MIACLGLPIAAFVVFLFWRIFEKAGYNGAMSLLLLIPGLGLLIALCILAFDQWPRDRNAMLVVPPQPSLAPGYYPQPQQPQYPYYQPQPPMQQPYSPYGPQYQPPMQQPPTSYP